MGRESRTGNTHCLRLNGVLASWRVTRSSIPYFVYCSISSRVLYILVRVYRVALLCVLRTRTVYTVVLLYQYIIQVQYCIMYEGRKSKTGILGQCLRHGQIEW